MKIWYAKKVDFIPFRYYWIILFHIAGHLFFLNIFTMGPPRTLNQLIHKIKLKPLLTMPLLGYFTAWEKPPLVAPRIIIILWRPLYIRVSALVSVSGFPFTLAAKTAEIWHRINFDKRFLCGYYILGFSRGYSCIRMCCISQ